MSIENTTTSTTEKEFDDSKIDNETTTEDGVNVTTETTIHPEELSNNDSYTQTTVSITYQVTDETTDFTTINLFDAEVNDTESNILNDDGIETEATTTSEDSTLYPMFDILYDDNNTYNESDASIDADDPLGSSLLNFGRYPY